MLFNRFTNHAASNAEDRAPDKPAGIAARSGVLALAASAMFCLAVPPSSTAEERAMTEPAAAVQVPAEVAVAAAPAEAVKVDAVAAPKLAETPKVDESSASKALKHRRSKRKSRRSEAAAAQAAEGSGVTAVEAPKPEVAVAPAAVTEASKAEVAVAAAPAEAVKVDAVAAPKLAETPKVDESSASKALKHRRSKRKSRRSESAAAQAAEGSGVTAVEAPKPEVAVAPPAVTEAPKAEVAVAAAPAEAVKVDAVAAPKVAETPKVDESSASKALKHRRSKRKSRRSEAAAAQAAEGSGVTAVEAPKPEVAVAPPAVTEASKAEVAVAAAPAEAVKVDAVAAPKVAETPKVDESSASKAPEVPAAVAPASKGISSDGVLSLNRFIEMLMEKNGEVAAERLGVKIGERQFSAARGKYEPSMKLSGKREANHTQTTYEEFLNLHVNDFDERNNRLKTSLEGLTPLGSTYRLSYNLDDLDNNLDKGATPGKDYKSYVGVELTQPLLKNFGPGVTNAEIRIARANLSLTSEKYREFLVGTVARAIQSYWQCYVAEQKLAMRERSRLIAENLYKINKVRYSVGKVSYGEVLDAEAGLRLREALVAAAEQSLLTARRGMLSMMDPDGRYRPEDIRIVRDFPQDAAEPFAYDKAINRIYEKNPVYLQALRQTDMDKLREDYARNQHLPQLDLKASYGRNGLAGDLRNSLRVARDGDYASWSVGVELSVPILGGLQSGNEMQAAKFRRMQSELRLSAEKTKLANDLDVVAGMVERVRAQAENYGKVVEATNELLRMESARFRAGKSEIRQLLDREVGLLKARESQIDTRLAYQYALVNLYSIDGTLLQRYSIEEPSSTGK
ncbi:MAG: TolC family protein [Chlorobiaceae bacterium]|nr:TolC family protein [Chlorobiaceae bacterium]